MMGQKAKKKGHRRLMAALSALKNYPADPSRPIGCRCNFSSRNLCGGCVVNRQVRELMGKHS